MEYLIGLALSLAVAGLALAVGFARDRAFYPTVAIVIASYYVLFAAMGATGHTVVLEIIVAGIFLSLAVAGYKKNLWLVGFAIVGHGIFDLAHPFLFANPGVPRWWPGFCSIFDVVFGGLMMVYLSKNRLPAR